MTSINSLDMQAIRQELVQALGRALGGGKGVAVYGAGDTAERWFASFLDDEESDLPDYFIDDTPGKKGTSLFGRPIISFEDAHTLCKSFLIVPCSYVPRTIDIMEASFRKDPIEEAVFCRSFDEYVFCRHSSEVLAAYDLLEDDFSKATYANMILARMGKAAQDPAFTRSGQTYFGIPEFERIKFDEVFVDCGAYVGDTIEHFLTVRLGECSKIFAFEPADKNFRALSIRTNRLKDEWGLSDNQIALIQAGVGEENYQTSLKSTMANDYATCVTFSVEQKCTGVGGGIPVVSLDSYFCEQAISFLKADIEGYEWKMLHGAEQVIKRDQPKLALSIYHSAFDMYRIPLWLQSKSPDYKLFVRQHYPCEPWDTVLYAYI